MQFDPDATRDISPTAGEPGEIEEGESFSDYQARKQPTDLADDDLMRDFAAAVDNFGRPEQPQEDVVRDVKYSPFADGLRRMTTEQQESWEAFRKRQRQGAKSSARQTLNQHPRTVAPGDIGMHAPEAEPRPPDPVEGPPRDLSDDAPAAEEDYTHILAELLEKEGNRRMRRGLADFNPEQRNRALEDGDD